MTTGEFFGLIERNSSPGDWELRETPYYSRAIRNRKSAECPICFVASALGQNPTCEREHIEKVYRQVGLGAVDAANITRSADLGGPLRQRLLEACRLIEKP